MRHTSRSKTWVLGAAALIGLGGAAGWYHTDLLSWYYVSQLVAADAEGRGPWVDRVATLDQAVVQRLLAEMANDDPTVCGNMEAALTALARRWGPGDARTLALATRLRKHYGALSPLGRVGALQVMTAILKQDGPKTWPAGLTKAAGEMLQASGDNAGLRTAALTLAAALLDRVPAGQWLEPCRLLADHGLGDRSQRSRLAAVQLVMRPALRGDPVLLKKVVPLLHDPIPLLRRAAVLALAPAREVVSEDDLLPLLHDADAEVQHLCEMALRSRGLDDAHLDLARLLSDARPGARLKVLERLAGVGDLDPSGWLRRLSQDPSPAVRAAAVRAAARQPRVNLGDRLREMADHDPSETVRQNARFYLTCATTR